VGFLTEILYYIIKRKKIWMLPPLIVGLIVGGLLIFAEGSALAPLIYSLF
jgi:hypothetical protein